VISKYVNFNQLNPEDMSEAFFDYVFLSKGEPQNPIWKKIKDDVDYWYPVDINLGGKEHKTVHFPVFIMNHVAIMPESKWPKGLFVHWWVTQKGKEKISKSKGGAKHIAEAAEKYGVDAMRLYYAHVGSPFVDVEWYEETVFTYKNRITMIWNLCNQLLSLKENRSNNTTHIDKWLVSMINRRIANVNETFSQYDLRASANEIFFETLIDLRWYLKRGGNHTKTINYFLDIWIKLLTPYTPHLSEELWHLMGNTNYVSNENFPVCNKNKISERVESGESLLSDVIEDINEILKITKLKPKKIFIYTAPRWKKEMLNKSLTLIDNKDLNVGYIIKETLKDEKNKIIAHDIAKYAPKLLSEIKKLNEKDKYRYKVDLNENEYLKEASPYLKDVFSCDVEIIDCDQPNMYDPTKKSKYAAPLKPALYIE
jgi:leucyl-tRNA synthetase